MGNSELRKASPFSLLKSQFSLRGLVMTRFALIALFLLSAFAARSEEPAKKPRAKAEEGFDVLGATLISVDTPVDLSSQSVRYKITGKKKIADFPATLEQTFDRKSDTEAEVVVRRVAYP